MVPVVLVNDAAASRDMKGAAFARIPDISKKLQQSCGLLLLCCHLASFYNCKHFSQSYLHLAVAYMCRT